MAAADASDASPSNVSLADNLARVRERIENACARAGRSSSGVTLVAVTKYAAPEQVREILSLGVGDLGENYVQQLVQRSAQLGEFHARKLASGDMNVPRQLRWHLIGHLQRNKVRQVLPHVTMVHSVDSLRLAEEIDLVASKLQTRVPVLLQVNTAEEPQKYGVAVGAATHLAEAISTMPNLRFMGVMCMAPYGASEDDSRKIFGRCREIFEEMRTLGIGGEDCRHLSMGMSDDFEAGILEGSTIVRIGSALFGGKAEGPDDEEE